jgi:hypothetical protein
MSSHNLTMDARHRYTCSCEECKGKVYMSVTTILGKAVPKDLSWWGMTIGVRGVRTLVVKRGADLSRMSFPDVMDAMNKYKLTVNHERDDGARRGTGQHKGLQDYIERGIIPMPAQYPEKDRGYARGIAAFITMYHPEFLASEVQVVSAEHAFAGTYDFKAIIKARLETVTLKARNGHKRDVMKFIPDLSALLTVRGDLKTSKWVYPASHFAQLEGYEGAAVEMGDEPTDARAVLHVKDTGHMELVPATAKNDDGTLRLACYEDFLALRRSADAIRRMEASYSRPK